MKFFIWGAICLCLIVTWVGRTSYIDYKAKTKYDFKLKTEQEKQPFDGDKQMPKENIGKPMPRERQKTEEIPLPTPPKKSIDIWDWALKVCGGLAGIKTLLELIDKFRRKK